MPIAQQAGPTKTAPVPSSRTEAVKGMETDSKRNLSAKKHAVRGFIKRILQYYSAEFFFTLLRLIFTSTNHIKNDFCAKINYFHCTDD